MIEISSDLLEELKSQGNKILVDVYADWCGPCKQITPLLERMSGDYPNVMFVKVNADINRSFLAGLNIRSIPAVLIYDGENLKGQIIGLNPESGYKNILDTL